MSILADNNGNIYMRKGDTGNITFNGIPKDQLYTVYFSVYNPDDDRIFTEASETANQAMGTVTFAISETFSNALEVGDWAYGVKICANGTEDTIVPRAYINDSGELIKETAPTFTVDSKVAEGD